MRKEVKTTDVEYEYYCDKCEKEIRIDRTRDDRIDDHLHKCRLCGQEVCLDCCRDYSGVHGLRDPWNVHICNGCFAPRKHIAAQIVGNRVRALATEKKLHAKLFAPVK